MSLSPFHPKRAAQRVKRLSKMGLAEDGEMNAGHRTGGASESLPVCGDLKCHGLGGQGKKGFGGRTTSEK